MAPDASADASLTVPEGGEDDQAALEAELKAQEAAVKASAKGKADKPVKGKAPRAKVVYLGKVDAECNGLKWGLVVRPGAARTSIVKHPHRGERVMAAHEAERFKDVTLGDIRAVHRGASPGDAAFKVTKA